MSPTFRMQTGAAYVDVPLPIFNYQVTVKMAAERTQGINGIVKLWDNGIENDYRTVKLSWKTLTAAKIVEIENFVSNELLSRSVNTTITLGTGSGLFLFGPDLGDEGEFTVGIISHTSGGRKHRPLNRFDYSIELLLISSPAYTAPAGRSQGSLSIGTVPGLPFPACTPTRADGYQNQITAGGEPEYSSIGAQGTHYMSEITIEPNTGNSAALITYLQQTARDNAFTVVPPTNSYIFGGEVGNSTTDVCLLSSTIKINHTAFNRFKITLSVVKK